MSRPQTVEQKRLIEIDNEISDITSSFDERMSLLESISTLYSGMELTAFRNEIQKSNSVFEEKRVRQLCDKIKKTKVPFAMAISALAREPISVEEQKKNGAFYTDYRLAKYMANDCADALNKNSKVTDLASGTGILLVGVACVYKEKYPQTLNEWLSENLYAFDLSEYALRGATCALAAMTNDALALKNMVKNWKQCDSLLDENVSNLHFDIIIGNPPWGKIKLTRHTFLKQNGDDRVYGASYDNFDDEVFAIQRDEVKDYAALIKEKYCLLGKGEVDIYMAFLQRCVELLKPGGKMSYLVPAGLIRSKGTYDLRNYLINEGDYVVISLLDNHPNFFSIDSRFKFVNLSFVKKASKKSAIESIGFNICTEHNDEVQNGEKIEFCIDELKKVREDLTIPEVNSQEEKNLFFKIYENGQMWGNTENVWQASIAREIDMTNDSGLFHEKDKNHAIPVIEGRMVQQYRFGAKAYVSGTGRSAKWIPNAHGIKAHYYCNKDELDRQKARIAKKRIGFCDIAGQTNERAMMCAIIPEDVVCGNKVPTIIFPNDETGDLIYLWIGIANSFVFDWMIRRIISTTVNFFLLYSVPIPNIPIDSELSRRIIENVKHISDMKEDYYSKNEMDTIRSEIEVLVADAYGLNKKDMELILKDFPLLHRKQVCLEGEKKSHVTRDYIMATCEEYYDNAVGKYNERLGQYKKKKARAFIPTEMVVLV